MTKHIPLTNPKPKLNIIIRGFLFKTNWTPISKRRYHIKYNKPEWWPIEHEYIGYDPNYE